MAVLVIASRTGVRLELTPVAPVADGDNEMPAWRARVVGDGLDAAVPCPEASWEPVALSDFLAGLDADWRGWEGERMWRSAERELHLTATHDKTNTVLLRVALEDGAPPRWRCECELEVDPGAFHAAAQAARQASR